MKKEEILAQCIDEILAGESTVDDCLARYPKISGELRPLLEIAANIQPEEAAPPAESVQRVRNHILETSKSTVARRDTLAWDKVLIPGGKLSLRVSAVITVFALIFAGGSTAYAAQKSLPDDVLYPVKICLENTQLAFTPSPQSRASLHLQLQERRIVEVVAQSSLGKEISPSAIEAAGSHLDSAVSEIGDLDPEDAGDILSQLSESTLNQQAILSQILKTTPGNAQAALEQGLDSARRGSLIAKVGYGNPAFLKGRPSVFDEGLDSDCFELEGTLLSAEAGNWNVGGLLLSNIVSSQKVPVVGSALGIEGLSHDGRTYVSKIGYLARAPSQVKVEGEFEGTSSDGEVWYVSNIPISKPLDIAPPKTGVHLVLNGTAPDDRFVASGAESTDYDEEEVRVNGVLVKTNRDEGTVTVEVGGFQAAINISEAQTEDEDGGPLILTDLETLGGADIEAADIYRRDGHFYAGTIRVDTEHGERHGEDGDGKQSRSQGSARDEAQGETGGTHDGSQGDSHD